MLGGLIPFTAAAQSAFDGVSYSLPAGWEVIPGDGSYVELSPSDLKPAESLSLVLMPTASVVGSQEEALSRSWDEVVNWLGLTPSLNAGQRFEASQVLHLSDGRLLLYGDGRVRDTKDNPYDMRLYILREGEVDIRVLGLADLMPASISYPLTSAINNPRLAYPIASFVLGLTTGVPKQPLPAPAVALHGLYRGISFFAGRFKNAFAYFYPDGRAFFGSRPPMNGFDPIQGDMDHVLSPNYWGRYSYDGQQGEIVLPYSNDTRYPIRPGTGDGLTLVTTGTAHPFFKAASVDGWKFQGTYSLTILSGATYHLDLSSSGHFSDDGLLQYVDHWIYPYRVSDLPGAGDYAINNFTITFHYTDGRIQSLPFSGLGVTAGDPSPASLPIGIQDDLLELSSPPVAQVRLASRLEPGPPARIRLSWPGSAGNYHLVSGSILESGSWVTAGEAVVVEGSESVVYAPLGDAARFFRLMGP